MGLQVVPGSQVPASCLRGGKGQQANLCVIRLLSHPPAKCHPRCRRASPCYRWYRSTVLGCIPAAGATALQGRQGQRRRGRGRRGTSWLRRSGESKRVTMSTGVCEQSTKTGCASSRLLLPVGASFPLYPGWPPRIASRQSCLDHKERTGRRCHADHPTPYDHPSPHTSSSRHRRTRIPHGGCLVEAEL